MTQPKLSIRLLMPVFNDWESSAVLMRKAEEQLAAHPQFDCAFVVADDFSTQMRPSDFRTATTLPVHVIRINRNVGHQRAIALGLCVVHEQFPCDYVVVLDADGEDKPEHVVQLVTKAIEEKDKVVFARRNRRYEGPAFRFFYWWYKLIFRLLTGKKITFGNYCAIPYSRLKSLTYISDIWNHFSGGIIRSRIPYTSIALDRGVRYAGHSKMNFISLVMHGLSAISVYTDTLAVRLLVGSIVLIMTSFIGIFFVAGIRLMTPLAIPGWASYVVIGILIIMFQAFLISLFLVFNVLNYRTQQHFIPALEYKKFIETID